MSPNDENAATVAVVGGTAERPSRSLTSAGERAVPARHAAVSAADAQPPESAVLLRAAGQLQAIRASLTPAQVAALRTGLDDLYDEAGLPW